MLAFYFNIKPRLKWNKIILAAKIFLFPFRRGSVLKFFKIILFSTWNHALTCFMWSSSRKRYIFVCFRLHRSTSLLLQNLCAVLLTSLFVACSKSAWPRAQWSELHARLSHSEQLLQNHHFTHHFICWREYTVTTPKNPEWRIVRTSVDQKKDVAATRSHSLMASVGESEVVWMTTIWDLLIMELWLVKSVTWYCYNSFCTIQLSSGSSAVSVYAQWKYG